METGLPMTKKTTVKEVLESVVEEMVDNGIYWAEVQAQFEKLFILRALHKSNGSVYLAAKFMGVHRNTLSKKIREHEIDRSHFRKTASSRK